MTTLILFLTNSLSSSQHHWVYLFVQSVWDCNNTFWGIIPLLIAFIILSVLRNKKLKLLLTLPLTLNLSPSHPTQQSKYFTYQHNAPGYCTHNTDNQFINILSPIQWKELNNFASVGKKQASKKPKGNVQSNVKTKYERPPMIMGETVQSHLMPLCQKCSYQLQTLIGIIGDHKKIVCIS